jgi:hypothetical protein
MDDGCCIVAATLHVNGRLLQIFGDATTQNQDSVELGQDLGRNFCGTTKESHFSWL